MLALSFTDQNLFPLIDEPTNHLDEASRKEVSDYLRVHHQGYIVVSHDRDFLNQVTDHILAIENTEIHLYQRQLLRPMKKLKQKEMNSTGKKSKTSW